MKFALWRQLYKPKKNPTCLALSQYIAHELLTASADRQPAWQQQQPAVQPTPAVYSPVQPTGYAAHLMDQLLVTTKCPCALLPQLEVQLHHRAMVSRSNKPYNTCRGISALLPPRNETPLSENQCSRLH